MMKTEKTRATWQCGMRVEGQAGAHILNIDQLGDMGGTDTGPNPMQYLLISLGSCVCTVAAIVARQQRIDLRGFSIEVEGDYDLDFIMGKKQDGRSGFTEIREKIFIDADLNEAEKVAFYEEIHRRCPVTGSLLNTTLVRYEIS
jgi:uncharacterized OsmC-like protein